MAEPCIAPLYGCPARAGIDRGYAGRERAAFRLPRTRGDRPGVVMILDEAYMVAPHARG